MNYLIRLFKLGGISLLLLLIAGSLTITDSWAGTFKVKKGGEGSEVAADSIRPHDYILAPKNLPCVTHMFKDNKERMNFTKKQNEWFEKLQASADAKTMKLKAEEIKALEFKLREIVYSGKATAAETTPLLRRIAELRFEHTCKFVFLQNQVLNLLSPEQYRELIRIKTEKGY